MVSMSVQEIISDHDLSFFFVLEAFDEKNEMFIIFFLKLLSLQIVIKKTIRIRKN